MENAIVSLIKLVSGKGDEHLLISNQHIEDISVLILWHIVENILVVPYAY